MSNPHVRPVGDLEDHDGMTVIVGVDYETVTIHRGIFQPGGGIRFTAAQLEEFTGLLARARREALPGFGHEPCGDRASAALAAIRERSRWISSEDGIAAEGATAERSAEDVPFLLGAIEAVLELHHRRDEPVKTRHVCRVHAYLHHPSPQWRSDVDSCPDCTVTEKRVCAEPSCRHECPDDDDWPCPTVRAITAELTRQEASDELQARP